MAHVLGVDVRTIRRWEAGSTPSSTHVKKFQDILLPAPDHRLANNIKPLLEITSDIMIAFDQDYRVIGQSRAHRALMHQLWGEDDLRGVMWMESRYVSERVREGVMKEFGGGRKMFADGLVSVRMPFLHEADGHVINGGRIDATFLRLAEGNISLSVTHRDISPEYVDGYLRPWVGSGAGGTRVTRAERGIRQRGEESGDQRYNKGEPQGIAGLAGGLADQSIDAGAEHAAEPVKRHLHRTDRAPQRRFLAR